jgi:Zn-dependent protease with chaperone function
LFNNLIYLIIVLLVYSTYQPPEALPLGGWAALAGFVSLLAALVAFTRLQFAGFERRLGHDSQARLDHRFGRLQTRHALVSIGLFAGDIYGLNLPAYFMDIPVFTHLPTLLTLAFMGLFLAYLSIGWAAAYPAYRRLYASSITRRSYVLSNIRFVVPLLLPWFVLSSAADLVTALPFAWSRRLLTTTEGEVAFFLVFLFGVALIGPALIQKFWGCRPLESGLLRQRIEALCRRAGLTYRNILYWPIFGGRMITAGVMGLISRFRYILVTRALLQYLAAEEIDAVVAHEIGHVKKKHLFFYLFFFAGFMLLTFASFDLIIYLILYIDPLLQWLSRSGLDQTTLASAVFALVLATAFFVYFRYIFGFFMRNFERQADIYVYTLFDSAAPLITTLEKIASASGQPADKPNWHHFSIAERTAYLRRCEHDRSWIRRHDRVITKALVLYVIGLASVGVIGYHLNYGETGQRIGKHFIEKLLLRQIDERPDSADLRYALGNLYYGIGDWARARNAYESVLVLNPQNVEAVNNLAWLYATCEDASLRNPTRALRLARQAAALEPSAHVLDTLAESLYRNGKAEEAVAVAERALEAATSQRAYYREQLDKFRRALTGQNENG